MTLTILYRGPLSSCNYDCAYCPFAKRRETAAEIDADRRALDRFVDWAMSRSADRLAIFFTPWGEALTHRHYQKAIAGLSHAANIEKVVIQTNLSCRLDWLAACDLGQVALWATYHPSQVSRDRFLGQCRELDRLGVRYSVGMVGLKEDADEIAAMRAALAEAVYLWVNAYKAGPNYYSAADINHLQTIDPLFKINLTAHASLGQSCRAGHSVISVDGDGTARRCHFIKEPIGNIYDDGFTPAPAPRPCTNQTCGCHIGYVHLSRSGLYETFAGGVLERIPAQPLWQKPAHGSGTHS